MPGMAEIQTTDVLNRLLDPLARCLTPEAARRLLNLRADPAVQARIDELADRSNEGQLTSAERAEYETYVRFIDFVSLLQAKARRLPTSTATRHGHGH